MPSNSRYENRTDLEREPLTTKIKQYIAGFLDGDGSIQFTIEKLTKIVFAQSGETKCPSILEYIQDYFGGSIIKRKQTRVNSRIEYSLSISNINGCVYLLENLAPYLIVKKPQADLLVKYLRNRIMLPAHTPANDPEKIRLYNKMKDLKTLDNYRKVGVDETKITDSYLMGLFDAEGCISAGGASRPRIGLFLSLKSSPALMQGIRNKYAPDAYVTCDKMSFLTKSQDGIMRILVQNSIVKNRQLRYAIKINKLTKIFWKFRTDEQNALIIKYRNIIRSEKKI